MRPSCFLAAILLLWPTTAVFAGDDILPPASERFAAPGVDEPVDFQRHVVPLLGRLGCNGRACHGSFQGQGGFRLSLFGYDFDMDHKSLTGKEQGAAPRANASSPADSLMLQKPTLAIDHEGGRRFAANSWQYRLLHRWIEQGARRSSPLHQLQRLEVEPAEIVFDGTDETRQLRVVAVWSDGRREDVTCLCRFQANDDAVARVDADGVVTGAAAGDTHVIAFYDNGVAAVPVLLPHDRGDAFEFPVAASPTRVDELVAAKLRKLNIAPSDIATDAEFLRRLSIDMTGTLPSPAEVEAFLADRSPGKRQRKIEELLDSPAYAAWWANKFCDFTGNSPFRQGEGRLGQQWAVQWYSWLHRRLAENAPYDEIIAGIVLATGKSKDQSYEDYAAEMSSYFRDENPADFADRESMPYFWSRRNIEEPADKALAFAHSFLGVRLQCAQCHKHPFDQWSQDDFNQFAAIFEPVRYGVAPASQQDFRAVAQRVGQPVKGNEGTPITPEILAHAQDGKSIAWRELFFDAAAVKNPRNVRLLGSGLIELSRDNDPRGQLMNWLRSRENPYFSRAIVHRIWANYFHRGLIEPVDDLSLANPPTNPELLDYLAEGLIEHGYDLKWLHREIVSSDCYQRSWRPNETNRGDQRNFSRAVARRLPAEVVYDGLAQAVAADEALLDVRRNLERRAIGHLSTRMAGTYAMQVFGKPDRDAACDCERSDNPSLLQAVFMQNDPLVNVRLRESGWLQEIEQRAQVADGGDELRVAALIRQAYLRTVSRPPTAEDTARAKRHFEETGSTVDGLRDLLWALLNSKEFMLNH